MKPERRTDIVEEAMQWLEAAGYRGDLSPLSAGLHDAQDGLNAILRTALPRLVQLPPQDRDEALSLVIDLAFECDHLQRHFEDARDCLWRVVAFLEGRAGSNQ